MEMLEVKSIDDKLLTEFMKKENLSSLMNKKAEQFIEKLQANGEATGTIMAIAVATILAFRETTLDEAIAAGDTAMAKATSKDALLKNLGIDKDRLAKVATSMATAVFFGYELAKRQLNEIPGQ